MKTIFKLSAILLMAVMFTAHSQAQKFGHSNTSEIFELMPEAKEAQRTLQQEQEKIQNRLMAMQVEYEQLVQEYMENEELLPQSPEKWSAADKQDKEAAITSLQQRIQRYQNNAQATLQEKQAELFEPILEKIETAIEKVRKENGFTIIFDDNVLLSFDKEVIININPMLKKELGLE